MEFVGATFMVANKQNYESYIHFNFISLSVRNCLSGGTDAPATRHLHANVYSGSINPHAQIRCVPHFHENPYRICYPGRHICHLSNIVHTNDVNSTVNFNHWNRNQRTR